MAAHQISVKVSAWGGTELGCAVFRPFGSGDNGNQYLVVLRTTGQSIRPIPQLSHDYQLAFVVIGDYEAGDLPFAIAQAFCRDGKEVLQHEGRDWCLREGTPDSLSAGPSQDHELNSLEGLKSWIDDLLR